MRRTTRTALTILLALSIPGPTRVAADDSDIFTALQVQPNVIILIDTSGSMDDKVNGVKKIDSAKTADIRIPG